MRSNIDVSFYPSPPISLFSCILLLLGISIFFFYSARINVHIMAHMAAAVLSWTTNGIFYSIHTYIIRRCPDISSTLFVSGWMWCSHTSSTVIKQRYNEVHFRITISNRLSNPNVRHGANAFGRAAGKENVAWVAVWCLDTYYMIYEIKFARDHSIFSGHVLCVGLVFGHFSVETYLKSCTENENCTAK